MPLTVAPADPVILRRWVVGVALFAIAWYLLLGPLADSLFGMTGKAPTSALKADRLVYEALVKLALLAGPAAGCAWLGLKTVSTRTFPPADFRVPVRMSVSKGAAALLAGVVLLLGAAATLVFQVASLNVSLQLAALLRRVG